MIDVLNETLLTPCQACREAPLKNPKSGRPCHPSAFYRYTTHGAKAVNGERVKLETAKTPRGLVTSREAIQRFIDRLTNPGTEDAGHTLIPATTRRQQTAVDRELAAIGI